MKRILIISGTALTLLSISTAALASTTTGTIAVSATIQAACSITTNPIDFGVYNSTLDTVSPKLVVTCTNTLPYTVGLNAGTTSGGTVTQRLMKSGSNTLQYNIFQDSNFQNVWGNTTGSWVSGTGNGQAQELTMYAKIPAGIFNPAGAYTDTVTATVTY